MTPSLLGRERRPRIALHIEEVVLRGFAPLRRAELTAAIAAALQHAPRRLVSGGHVQREHRLSPASNARAIGTAITQALPGRAR